MDVYGVGYESEKSWVRVRVVMSRVDDYKVIKNERVKFVFSNERVSKEGMRGF